MNWHHHRICVNFVGVAILAVSVAAAKEPAWQEIANNSEEIVEVDAANIRVREGMLTAWVRHSTPRDMEMNGRKFRSAIALAVFDCDAEKSGVSSTTAFAELRGEGKIVHTEEGLPVGLVRLSYQRPGTSGYEVLRFVCEHFEQLRVNVVETDTVRMTETGKENQAEVDVAQVRGIPQASTPVKITRPVNPDDYYPLGSIRRQEQGSPVVLACVGPNGRLLRAPVVTDTSGFPELDGAAIKVAKATQYASGTERGTALSESCLKFKVDFTLKN
jgi:TonB family protein